MLSKSAAEIPTGDGWHYEPKWDGFRCIVFRDGDEIELASRNERPFTRYFPELLEPLLASLPARCVVDGEIVVPATTIAVSTSTRCCNASTRPSRACVDSPPRRRRRSSPSTCWHSTTTRCSTVRSSERHRLLTRATLAAASRRCTSARRTTDAAVAHVVHRVRGRRPRRRRRQAPRRSVHARQAHADQGQAPAHRRLRHRRYRIHKDGNGVGSLLLGLYDDDGDLHHVGVVASFTVKRRAELLAELEPLTHNALDNHPWRDWAEWPTRAEESGKRMPGAGSRWNAGKDLSWVPLRIERVAEVTFGQLQEGRFRHGSQFVRWRPDREPESCRYDQLEVASPVAFAIGRRSRVAHESSVVTRQGAVVTIDGVVSTVPARAAAAVRDQHRLRTDRRRTEPNGHGPHARRADGDALLDRQHGDAGRRQRHAEDDARHDGAGRRAEVDRQSGDPVSGLSTSTRTALGPTTRAEPHGDVGCLVGDVHAGGEALRVCRRGRDLRRRQRQHPRRQRRARRRRTPPRSRRRAAAGWPTDPSSHRPGRRAP